MNRFVFGGFGSGKSALITYFGLHVMRDKARYRYAKNILCRLQKGGFTSLQMPESLVQCDFYLQDGENSSIFMKAQDFRVPNEKKPFRYFCPGTHFVFDEAYRVWNSRRASSLDEFQIQALETCRHNDYSLDFVAPRFMDIDTKVRDTCGLFIKAVSIELKGQKKYLDEYYAYSHYQMTEEEEKAVNVVFLRKKIKTIWHTYEYDTPEFAEKSLVPIDNWTKFKCHIGLLWPLNYLTASGRLYRLQLEQILEDNAYMRRKKYVFKDIIFEHYNSQYYRPAWYKEFKTAYGRQVSALKYIQYKTNNHHFSVKDYDTFNNQNSTTLV